MIPLNCVSWPGSVQIASPVLMGESACESATTRDPARYAIDAARPPPWSMWVLAGLTMASTSWAKMSSKVSVILSIVRLSGILVLLLDEFALYGHRPYR